MRRGVEGEVSAGENTGGLSTEAGLRWPRYAACGKTAAGMSLRHDAQHQIHVTRSTGWARVYAAYPLLHSLLLLQLLHLLVQGLAPLLWGKVPKILPHGILHLPSMHRSTAYVTVGGKGVGEAGVRAHGEQA